MGYLTKFLSLLRLCDAKKQTLRIGTLLLIIWVALAVLLYRSMLLADDRSAVFSGMLLGPVAIAGSAIAGAVVIAKLLSAAIASRGDVRMARDALAASAAWSIVAMTFLALFPVLQCGVRLHRLDQDEARTFVDSRISELGLIGPDTVAPATQADFVGGHELPRLLRCQRFYSRESEHEFRIEFRADFDGGWIYSSVRHEWVRHT